MDLSKLPKLSETQKAKASDQAAESQSNPAPSSPLNYRLGVQPDPGGAWISIGVGVILLLLQPRLLQFIAHKLFGTQFAPFMQNGEEVPYTTLIDFYSDLGIISFALILVLEGITLLFATNRTFVWIAFVLTLFVTAYNLLYLVKTYNAYGLPIVSAFAVVFGVYIAVQHWRTLQITSRVAIDAK
jgi:hypothetical protein